MSNDDYQQRQFWADEKPNNSSQITNMINFVKKRGYYTKKVIGISGKEVNLFIDESIKTSNK